MAYCTQADLLLEKPEKDLIQLTDDEGEGIIHQGRLSAAVAKADAKIDSLLSEVADVPFATIPPIVKEWSKSLAIYYLYFRKDAVEDKMQKAVDRIFAEIQKVVDGDAGIPSDTGETIDSGGISFFPTREDRQCTIGTLTEGEGTLDTF
jgi:phage gp36-like protein